ncbi:MAG: DUF2284 domain-containing protein [Methanobrevibacter sp.]
MDLKDIRKMSAVERYDVEISMEEFLYNCLNIDLCYNKCLECDSFNRNWSCPPFNIDVCDFWAKYDKIHVYLIKLNFSKKLQSEYIDISDVRKIFKKYRTLLNKELLGKEKDFKNSMSISGGCSLCKVCNRVEGKPCNYPNKMRPAIDAYGVDVGKLLDKYFNIQLQWVLDNHLPEYLCVVSAIVY